ncbi:hypothetical protein EZV62_015570 [Acer yangbiense]|uniref:Uncharacterized protein n=1 Tax=Acer yangbiense TaxID=1000413 RepID=A0A5C7HL66_9ROSI|nr:hypothetical protein EZV62_015570 [Acer yangbiense]
MTFSAFLHLGLIDTAGALHCRISKRMFAFEDHNGISEAIYPGIVGLGLLIVNIGCSTKIHINAFDALGGWKKEGLPSIEVLAAAQWKFRRYLLDFISRLYFNFFSRLFEEAQLVYLVLKDISTCGIDMTPVLALKRKALMLKREGKLAEAKENLSWIVNLSL